MKCDLCGSVVRTYYEINAKPEAPVTGLKQICSRCARLITDLFTTAGSELTFPPSHKNKYEPCWCDAINYRHQVGTGVCEQADDIDADECPFVEDGNRCLHDEGHSGRHSIVVLAGTEDMKR